MDRLSDVFVEQIIKKKFVPKDYAVIGFAVLVGVAVTALSFLIPAAMPPILVLVVAGIGKYDRNRLTEKHNHAKIFVSKNMMTAETAGISARGAKRGGVLMIFNPEERALKAIRPFLPRQVALNAFGRN